MLIAFVISVKRKPSAKSSSLQNRAAMEWWEGRGGLHIGLKAEFLNPGTTDIWTR